MVLTEYRGKADNFAITIICDVIVILFDFCYKYRTVTKVVVQNVRHCLRAKFGIPGLQTVAENIRKSSENPK